MAVSCRIILPEDELQPRPASGVTKPRHNGDELKGHLEVITDTPLSSNIQIHFEGFSRSWRLEDAGGQAGRQVLTGKYRFLCQTQHLDSHQFSQSATSGPKGRICYRIPFEFTIPHRLVALPHYTNHEFTRLPPSLKNGEVFRTWSEPDIYMQPIIVYILRASTRCQKHVPTARNVIDDCQREIPIVPSGLPAPPLEIRDFPGEYRLSTKRKIRRHLWSPPSGVLSISSAEPAPWNIFSPNARPKTEVALDLKFEGSEKPIPGDCPCRWLFVIRSSVEAMTFCSTEPGFKEQPTIQAVSRSPALNLRMERFSVEKTKFSNHSLHLSRITCEGTSHKDTRSNWTARIKIPLPAPKSLVPTFVGPLSARRYVARLEVQVSEMHHSLLNLLLPVQAIFDDRDTASKVQSEQPPHISQSLSSEIPPEIYDSWADLELSEDHTIKPPPYQ